MELFKRYMDEKKTTNPIVTVYFSWCSCAYLQSTSGTEVSATDVRRVLQKDAGLVCAAARERSQSTPGELVLEVCLICDASEVSDANKIDAHLHDVLDGDSEDQVASRRGLAELGIHHRRDVQMSDEGSAHDGKHDLERGLCGKSTEQQRTENIE
jgi:hypothetical protein